MKRIFVIILLLSMNRMLAPEYVASEELRSVEGIEIVTAKGRYKLYGITSCRGEGDSSSFEAVLRLDPPPRLN